MKIRACLPLMLFVSVIGCTSRLCVTKVTRDPDGDHVRGFRYYLSRPYVIVQEPVLVSETIRVGRYTPLREPAPEFNIPSIKEIQGRASREMSPRELEAMKRRVQKDGAVEQASYQDAEGELPDPRSVGLVNQGTSAALDTVPSDVGEHLKIPEATPQKLTDRGRLKGSLQVVFLPDFEEAYAVQCHNALAKSAYKLTFRDGWELTDVSGEFDSTTVAIELLNTIDSAINAAKGVAEAGIDRQKAVSEASAKANQDRAANAGGKDRADGTDPTHYQEIIRVYIKPGVYRINKPWEMDGGLQAQQGDGLLSSLGLTLQQVTERQVLPAPRVGITNLGKAKTGEVGR